MSGWHKVLLEEVTTKVGSGATPRGGKSAYKESGIPLIRSMNVHFDGFRDKGLAFIDEKQAEGLKAVEVKPNDVLLNITGASIGRVAIAPKTMDGARVNQHVCIIRPNEKLNSGFLRWYLASPARQDFIMNVQSGVTRQALTKGKILEFEVPLPKMVQQKRIVAKIEELFSHIDAGIEALKKAKQLLKQYRQSVLKAAVTGELTKEWREANKDKVKPASQLLERILKERRQKWEEQQLEQFEAKGKTPKDDKWKGKYKAPVSPDSERIHELPKTWCWATFDQIGDRVTVGHVGSMKNEYIDSGIPFLRSQNVRENRYDAKGLKYVSRDFHAHLQKSSLQPGDLVTVRSGSVGVTCAIPGHLKEANCSDLVIVKKPKAVIPKLAAYYMNTITQTKVAAEKVGVALTHFNTKSMAEMPLPVPPLEEQHKITELVDEKLSDIEKLNAVIEEQLIKSEKNKQSILASAFSGNLN